MAIRTLENNGNPLFNIKDIADGQSVIWDQRTQSFRNASFMESIVEIPSLESAERGQVLKVAWETESQSNVLEWGDGVHPIISDFKIVWPQIPVPNNAGQFLDNPANAVPLVDLAADTPLGGNLAISACFQNIPSVDGLAIIRRRSRPFRGEWGHWITAYRDIPVQEIISITRNMPALPAVEGTDYQWQLAVRDEHNNVFASNTIERKTMRDPNWMPIRALYGVSTEIPGEPGWMLPDMNARPPNNAEGMPTLPTWPDITDGGSSFHVHRLNVDHNDYFFVAVPNPEPESLGPDDPAPRSIASIAAPIGGNRLMEEREQFIDADFGTGAGQYAIKYRRNTSGETQPFTYSVIMD